MFLCTPCHKTSGCRLLPFLHPASFGRCEDCGETAGCVDCHSYGTPRPTPDSQGGRDGR